MNARMGFKDPLRMLNNRGMEPMNVQPVAQGIAMGQQMPQQQVPAQQMPQQQAPAQQNPVETLPPEAKQVIAAKMQDPKFSAWFKQLPPDQQQQVLMRLAMDYKGQNSAVNEQLAAAEMLRGTKGAEGRQAGRVYVAANPLEHIAAGYKQKKGLDQYEEAMKRKKELSDMQSQGLYDVMATQLREGV